MKGTRPVSSCIYDVVGLKLLLGTGTSVHKLTECAKWKQ